MRLSTLQTLRPYLPRGRRLRRHRPIRPVDKTSGGQSSRLTHLRLDIMIGPSATSQPPYLRFGPQDDHVLSRTGRQVPTVYCTPPSYRCVYVVGGLRFCFREWRFRPPRAWSGLKEPSTYDNRGCCGEHGPQRSGNRDCESASETRSVAGAVEAVPFRCPDDRKSQFDTEQPILSSEIEGEPRAEVSRDWVALGCGYISPSGQEPVSCRVLHGSRLIVALL